MLPRAQAILTPPAWAEEWVLAGGATLRSRVVADAVDASAGELRGLVEDAYAQLLAEATSAGHRHVARMWNFIPDLHATLDNGEDRYMAFNAGRHDALNARFGDRLAQFVPAATGVGHASDDLVIWALATRSSTPVENPLQTPSYRYSKQYGTLPPCFSRATRTPCGLLISGTAAIRGEDTRAAGDLAQQLALTFENLNAVAGGHAIASARAYVPPESDSAQVLAACKGRFGQLELVEAELCRKNLLVEIEGIVTSG